MDYRRLKPHPLAKLFPKYEAFIRDYSDMAEWKGVIEAVKTQLGAKHV